MLGNSKNYLFVGLITLILSAFGGCGDETLPTVELEEPLQKSLSNSRDQNSGGACDSLSSTLRVPQDCSTIQQAVNSAAGPTIIAIAEGTYTENVRIDNKNSIRLQTQSPGEQVTIQALLADEAALFILESDLLFFLFRL